jgi:glycosyltransferase involved in cell wall biosynthesis
MAIITESFISLIICTRNRASQLTAALVELNKIEYTKKYEIILVDNGSTDSTRTVIAQFIQEHTAPFKYIFEAKAGLSRARNAGLSHAQGDIVAFTDDDCYPTIDFLSSISKCFEDQTIAYSGGRVLLFDQSDRRITIQEKNSYEVLEPLSYISAGLIHGANISFRRDTILELKGFDERLGAGTQFKSGEDTDILRRFSALGYKGVYDPAITVFHHHGRKTLEEETKLMEGYDRGNASCMLKHTMHGKLRRLYIKHWYWLLRKASFRIKTRHVCYAVLFYIKYGPSFSSVFKHPHDCLSNEGNYKD